MKICSRCVMDESANEIIFDQNGTCNFCKNYYVTAEKELRTSSKDQEKLNRLILDVKKSSKNQKYDCLIGVSGGVDSSYVAYLLRTKYKLRVLAVHLDNGWNSELAVSNIEQLMEKLGIELITNVLNWKEFSDIQRSFLKSSISNIEIPTDHAIWATLLRTANKHNIKYIFAGNNIVTESIMPASWLYTSKDFHLIKSIQEKFGTEKIKSFPYLSIFNYFYFLVVRGIRWVPILNWVSFDKAKAKETLISELGWRDYGGKHYESIFTRFFHASYLPQKFGFDLRKSYLSALICSGQITRDQALDELNNPPATPDVINADNQYVEKKLQLDNSINFYINAENKTHESYRNNEKIWNYFSSLIGILRNFITRV